MSASEREHDEEEQEIEIEAARERARRGESERERREKNGSRKRVSRWLVAGPSMAWRSGGGREKGARGIRESEITPTWHPMWHVGATSSS